MKGGSTLIKLIDSERLASAAPLARGRRVRDRRRFLVVVACVGALLVPALGPKAVKAVGTAAQPLLRGYQPLASCCWTSVGPDHASKADAGDEAAQDVWSEKGMAFRPGQHFLVSFHLRNSSSSSLRVTRIPATHNNLFEGAGARLGPAHDERQSRPLARFRPFALSPGQDRLVELRYRFVDCPPPNPRDASFRGFAQTVHFEARGINRHAEIELPESLSVHYSDELAGSCNARR